jgi:predicted transcriptional regulator
MNSEEVRQKVIELRQEKNLALVGVASSNIRRQLKRLRELYLIEKVSNNYRITENLSMNEILKEKIERFMIPMIYERVREYFDAVEKEFSK